MILTVVNSGITVQDFLVAMQLMTTILLGYLAYKTFKRDSSKVHIEMYSDIERLQLLFVEKFKDINKPVKGKLVLNIQEQLCNRYEIICNEYIYNRLDKRMFREMYFNSLIQHVEDENYTEFYCPNGKYNCYEFTLKVYLQAKKESSKK